MSRRSRGAIAAPSPAATAKRGLGNIHEAAEAAATARIKSRRVNEAIWSLQVTRSRLLSRKCSRARTNKYTSLRSFAEGIRREIRWKFLARGSRLRTRLPECGSTDDFQ